MDGNGWEWLQGMDRLWERCRGWRERRGGREVKKEEQGMGRLRGCKGTLRVERKGRRVGDGEIAEGESGEGGRGEERE